MNMEPSKLKWMLGALFAMSFFLCVSLSYAQAPAAKAEAAQKSPSPLMKEAFAVSKDIIAAIKAIEAYEAALSGDKTKVDEGATVAAVLSALKNATQKFNTFATKVPAPKEGHVDTARTRLQWATDRITKF